MNKKARLTYEQQTSMIIVQRETIALMRQQLALQDAVFVRLFDFVGELRGQMQASEQATMALIHPDSNREKG
jgi:hypothetical protein